MKNTNEEYKGYSFDEWRKIPGDQIIDINKKEWIPGIKEEIASWEDFSKSIFCEDPADKQNALSNANELRKFLALGETNTLTKQQFEHYLVRYFWK